MAEYRTGVCDKCGSEAQFVWQCPDGWYSGAIGELRFIFNDIDGIKQEHGLFCSPECLMIFTGSYMDAAKQILLERIQKRIGVKNGLL